MTDHALRPFSNSAAIRRVGEGLLDCTLPKSEWTHEAHLAACIWLILERPDIAPEAQLPAIIRAYNVATGVVNDDTQGYHETLTVFWMRTVGDFNASKNGTSLLEKANEMVAKFDKDYPLRFYSREFLFSDEARARFLEGDLSRIDQ